MTSSAKGASSSLVLLADDEPEYLEWIEEYFVAKGLTIRRAFEVEGALDALAKETFRLIVADMNIPASEAALDLWAPKWPLVKRYHGLALVLAARNLQYGAHSVIGYTVHDDPELGAAMDKVNARYVLKGRPGIFKGIVEKSLAPAPRPVR